VNVDDGSMVNPSSWRSKYKPTMLDNVSWNTNSNTNICDNILISRN